MLNRSLTDALRGIAVLIIIICHFIGGGFEIRYFTPLGGIGVAIFLFLSGYGLNESFLAKGLNGFWTKKTLRILLPYLLWCGLLAITVLLLPYDSPAFRRYWYLEYLALWYAIFYFSKKFLPKYSELIMIVLAVCMFPFMRNIQTEQSFSFLLGVVVSGQKLKLEKINKWVLICTMVSVFTFGITCLFLKQIHWFRAFGEESFVVKLLQLGTKLPIGLSIIIAVSYLYRSVFFWRIFEILGIVSLELYLVQMPFPGYIQGDWMNLSKISLLVAVLTIILHFAVIGINALLKRIEWPRIKTNKQV